MKNLHKILNFDRKYLFSNLHFSAISQISSTTSVLVLSVVAANFIAPEVYGIYKYLISLGIIATTFTLSGSYAILTKSVARGYTGTVISLLKYYLLWNILPLLICFSMAAYYLVQGNSMFALALFVIGLLLPATQAFRLFQSYLNGIEDFKNLAIFSTILAVVPASAIAVSMILFESPLIFIVVNFVVTFLVTLGLFLLSIRLHQPNPDAVDAKANHESAHMSFMMYLGSLAQQLDQVVTFQFLGPAKLALYNFALAPANQLSLITNIIIPLTAPRMAKNSWEGIKKNILKKVILMTFLSGLIYAAYFLAAPFIFKYLFPAYQEAVIYSQILALIIFTSPTFLFQQAFSSHSKIKELYIIKTIVPIFKIIAIFGLTFTFGLPGLITSIVVTYVFRYLLYAIFMKLID